LHSSRVEANVWKYYLFQFFLNFQLWWPIWIIYLTEERGLTLGQVTLIDVPFWLSIILLQVPAAAMADRFGRKPTLIAASAAFATAVTAFGLATNFWLILVSYLVWGVAFALLNGTESAFIYDSLKACGREHEYARIYGRGWAIQMTAGVAGTLIGAPLAAATNLPFPIVLSGGLAAMAVVAALLFVEPDRARSERPGADGEEARPHLSYGQIIRDSVSIFRHRPNIRYGILFYGLLSIGSIAPIFLFQPFLREHGFDVDQLGIYQTPMRVAGIVAALAAQQIVARFGERGTFIAMPVVIFGSYLVLAGWDAPAAQIAFLAMNFVVVLSQPTVTNYVNKRVESEQRATVLSLATLGRSAILIPAAPLLGALAEESLTAAFLAGAGLVAAMGLPLMLAWAPRLSRAEGAERAAMETAGVSGGGR
jgi:MFS family permease